MEVQTMLIPVNQDFISNFHKLIEDVRLIKQSITLNDDALRFTLKEACQKAKVSRNKLFRDFEALNLEIKTDRKGRRFILREDLQTYLNAQQTA